MAMVFVIRMLKSNRENVNLYLLILKYIQHHKGWFILPTTLQYLVTHVAKLGLNMVMT